MLKNTILSSNRILVIALLAFCIASFYLISGFWHPIAMAFILSLLLYPQHKKVEAKFGRSKNIAALISCLLLTFVIVLPFLMIFTVILKQASESFVNLTQWVSDGNLEALFQHPFVNNLMHLINNYLPFQSITQESITEKLSEVVSEDGASFIGSAGAQILSDIGQFFSDFFLMLFVLFFLLRDHDKIIETIRHVLPLSRSQEDMLLSEIEVVANSAILGSFLTAIAQGIAGGFAMWLAGFQGFFWGTMIGFASFVPVIGTALIWIPATIVLVLIGETGWATFLAIWSIFIVGSIDNLLRPFLMQGQGNAGMDTLMIFISLLGGLQAFGLSGLIYGPLIFAITLVLFKIYEIEFKGFLDSQDKN
ncbi:AI-2E family transporter [Vibrio sp.]|nr:AI-2E family transporter [Vibrio sp.]